eukprot:contig_27583_g6791
MSLEDKLPSDAGATTWGALRGDLWLGDWAVVPSEEVAGALFAHLAGTPRPPSATSSSTSSTAVPGAAAAAAAIPVPRCDVRFLRERRHAFDLIDVDLTHKTDVLPRRCLAKLSSLVARLSKLSSAAGEG